MPRTKSPLKQAKPAVVIATNNGDIGGGEVMLLNIAAALETAGHSVTLLAPSPPNQLAAAAKAAGHRIIVLECHSRLSWLLAIRRWRQANPTDVLWCNGLLPAFATSLLPNRLVHLHQRPEGVLKVAAWLAKFRSLAVVVPSLSMQSVIPGARVLPNWIAQARVSKPDASTVLRVGFIGRLATIKGIDVLAEALTLAGPSAEGMQLIVAGEARFTSDADSQAVSQALSKLGDRVTYLGWVKPEVFLSQVDVVCCPSVWQEPFGLVVAEAMAAGKPVVASRVGGIPEILGDDYPYLVEPGDPVKLAAALVQISEELKANEARVGELTAGMERRWLDLFSPVAGVRNVEALLRELP